MVISLPIFNVGMSIGMFWISAIWLFDLVHDIFWKRTPWAKIQEFKSNRLAQVFALIYIAFVVGMLYSEDMSYGWRDLRMKSPLFIIPFALSFHHHLPKAYYLKLYKLFILSVVFSVSCALLVRYQILDIPYENVREVTVLFITRISHVRLSLMVVLAGMMAIWLAREHKQWLYLIVVAYFGFFLVSIQSGTGIIIWLVTLTIFILASRKSSSSLNQLIKYGFILMASSTVLYIGYCVHDYYDVEKGELENLKEQTVKGTPYVHNLDNPQLENKHYVWLYYAEEEMVSAWNARSKMDLDGPDGRGQNLKSTLIRYMTSKGAHKDSVGVFSLTEEDVYRIESGVPTVVEGSRFPLHARVEKVILEVEKYRFGWNPGGNSLTQRLEYWKIASTVILDNPILGVGTGDVQLAYDRAYADKKSQLHEKYRLRAHNQYLTLMLTLGIPFALLCIGIMLFYFYKKIKSGDLLFVSFIIIAALSFITEDTLETQAGITFIAFFFVLMDKAKLNQD
ncbi:MAG: O-antigen ligase [Flavobacteriales bacterium]|jgi:O-antigen ligase